ncbi:unnamed protein product [uncultured bacterium]|nr:unnamed protein product [uncultured bacterium]
MPILLESGGDVLLESGDAALAEDILALGFREALVDYLRADAQLSALIADRLFISAPDDPGAGYPYLVYELHKARGGAMHTSQGRTYGRDLSGSNGLSEAHVALIVTSSRESECVAVARQLGRLLEDFTGVLSGVRVLSSSVQIEYDAAIQPPKGSTQWIHELGTVYRIVHLATPSTA